MGWCFPTCRSLHGGVDWNIISSTDLCLSSSRSLHGGVDWNAFSYRPIIRKLESLPSRERGLNFFENVQDVWGHRSLPSREHGLKCIWTQLKNANFWIIDFILLLLVFVFLEILLSHFANRYDILTVAGGLSPSATIRAYLNRFALCRLRFGGSSFNAMIMLAVLLSSEPTTAITTAISESCILILLSSYFSNDLNIGEYGFHFLLRFF